MIAHMEKWALVTGASSGIGYAVASRLADLGYNIMMVSRTAEKLDKAAGMLGEDHKGLTVVSVAMDLAVPGAA